MQDVAMRRRIVALVLAALLAVAVASVVTATIADDKPAIAARDGDNRDT